MTERIELEGAYNRIVAVLSFDESKKQPFVILSHGLLSSKDSPKYLYFSEVFLKHGIGTLRFDYHGCGESGGNIKETTLSKRLENLERVFEYVVGNRFVDSKRIGLLGSSFGGLLSLIKASRDKRVNCIVLLSTPFNIEREKVKEEMDFEEEFYEDLNSYNIIDEARRVSKVLLIHGEKDEVVPLEEGKKLFSFFKEPKRIEIIEGADHRFKAPFLREKVVELSLQWFRRFFFP